MGFDPITAIGSAVVSNVVGKAMGGGGGAKSVPQSSYTKIPGSSFEPFTYKGVTGSVTGTPSGEAYDWSAELPQWLIDLGAGGGAAAGGLFADYYRTAAKDPYQYADEFYQRGVDVLQPEFARQNLKLKEGLFGSGRLGQMVGGVNPNAFSQQKAQQETLAKLYADSLSGGQAFQTNRLNQLSRSAEAAKNLGLLPMTTEQDLISWASDLERARAAARGGYSTAIDWKNTPQQVFGGQIGNLAGKAFGSMFGNTGSAGLPTSGMGGTPWMSSSNQDWASGMGFGNSGGGFFSGLFG